MQGVASKDLLRIGGRSALGRALEMLCSIDAIVRIVVLAVAPLSVKSVLEEVERHSTKPFEVTQSGRETLERMRVGLPLLQGCTHVLLHEASRPFASRDLALRVLQAAYAHEAAFPAVRSPDPLRVIEGGRLVRDFLDSSAVLAQDPQAFTYPLLTHAYQAAGGGEIAIEDEAQLVSAFGHEVIAVEGEPWNIKLVDADDVAWLETYVKSL